MTDRILPLPARPGPRSNVGERLRVPWQAVQNRRAVSGDVQIGSRFRLGRGSSVWSAHGLRIGHDVAIGRFCTVEVDGQIGDFSLISAHVGIVGRADHDISELGTPVRYSSWIGARRLGGRDRVVIGRDVWIGWGAVVLSGIDVGDGAVVAAGAVVVANVEPFSIVAGNPARVVGVRFNAVEQAQHLELLESFRIPR